MEKRKVLRRSSAQFYISAEDHIRNEINHERNLTETSRLTSSWASLRLSGNEKHESSDYGCSSPGSSGSSPHRPNSFSGPLMISVTCSSNGPTVASTTETKQSITTMASSTISFSRPSSCYPSPVASPVSSRVQCYSPGMGLATSFSAKKRTASVSSGGVASPLILNLSRGQKRIYSRIQSADNRSSTEGSRESSPERPFSRFSKMQRTAEHTSATACVPSAFPSLGSPPQDSCRWTPPVLIPSSPTPANPSVFFRMASNSPSTTSLPSPMHSNLSAGLTNSPNATVEFAQPLESTTQVDAKPHSPSSSSCPESSVSNSFSTENSKWTPFLISVITVFMVVWFWVPNFPCTYSHLFFFRVRTVSRHVGSSRKLLLVGVRSPLLIPCTDCPQQRFFLFPIF